jgi:hypothetical protein
MATRAGVRNVIFMSVKYCGDFDAGFQPNFQTFLKIIEEA